MLQSDFCDLVSPTTRIFRGSITRLACSLSTLNGWVTLLRPRLVYGLLARLWPCGIYIRGVSTSSFKEASNSSYSLALGLSWRNTDSAEEPFLFSLPEFSEKQKNSFKIKLEKDKNLKKRLGETLIIILDKMDDLEKSFILSQVFACYIAGKIEFNEFRRLASAIDLSFIDDLKMLCAKKEKINDFSHIDLA